MIENLPNPTDEKLSNGVERPLRRTSRLSVLKPQPIVENHEREREQENDFVELKNEEKEDEIEDPPELYLPGDILWHRVPGTPWWPALVYGCYYEDFVSSRVVKYGARAKRSSSSFSPLDSRSRRCCF